MLVPSIRKRLKLEALIHGILLILSLTLFEKTPLAQMLTLSVEGTKQPADANQRIWSNNLRQLSGQSCASVKRVALGESKVTTPAAYVWNGIANLKSTLKKWISVGGVLSIAIQLQYQIVRLISGIVLARAVGPAELGLYSFGMSFITIIQIIPAYGLDGAIIRFSGQYVANNSWELLRGLWRTGILVSIAYGILTAAAAVEIFSSIHIARIGAFSPKILQASAIVLLCMPVVFSLGAVLRAAQPGVIGQLPQLLLQPWLYLLCMLIALMFERQLLDAEFAIWLQGVAAALTVAIALVLVRKYVPDPVVHVSSRVETATWMRSAFFFLLLGGLSLINTQTDVIMLGILSTARETGIYRVASNGGNMVSLSSAALIMYLGPKISRMYASGEHERLQRMMISGARFGFIVSFLVAATFMLFGEWILSIVFGTAYVAAFYPLVILCLGQLVSIGIGMGALLLSMTGYERETAAATALAAVGNILLNAVLIPMFGAVGSAVATASTLILWRVMLAVLAKRKTGISVVMTASLR